MRILFLHEVNYLKKPIFEMHEFPEYLAEKGHEVGFVQFPEGEPKESLSKIPWKQKIQGRVVKDSQITLYTPKTVSTSTLGRIRAALTFSKAFASILEDFEPDVVVSFSVPTSGWQALKTCRKSKIPYLFRALDVSHKIRKSAFSPLILAAEKYIYSRADWVSANNPAMLEYCYSIGAYHSRASTDLPPLDVIHFLEAKNNRTQSRLNLSVPLDATVLLYMGSFFYFSGLPELIMDFSKQNISNTYMVLIGGGEQDRELRDLVASLGMEEQVIFTGFVSYADLPFYLGMADIALNPMQSATVSNAALPNKVLQYMASGLPVISTPLAGLESLLSGLNGLVFSSQGESIFLKAIKTLSQFDLSELGQQNQESIASIFSTELALDVFEVRLKELVKSK